MHYRPRKRLTKSRQKHYNISVRAVQTAEPDLDKLVWALIGIAIERQREALLRTVPRTKSDALLLEGSPDDG